MTNNRIRKIIISILVFAVVLGICPAAEISAGSFRTGDKPLVICIDPGHGGDDEGAIYKHDGVEVMEKDINLSIANAIRDELLKYENVTVIMTREDDVKVEPQERADIAFASDADVFISVHVNANPDEPSRGCMILCNVSHYQAPGAKTPDNYMVSSRLGGFLLDYLTAKGLLISDDMDEFGGFEGIVRRPYSEDGGASREELYDDGSVADYYYQLRFAAQYGIPAVVVEHAYLSSDEDYEEYLSSEEKLAELGVTDALAIAETYNLNRIEE